MGSELAIVAAALIVGWAVWWWLIHTHVDQTATLSKQVEELERKHESR